MTEFAGRLGLNHMMALAIIVVACVFDLRLRRIPNALTLGSAAAALVYSFVANGLAGLGNSMLGWAAGLAVFLPFFALGGLGAGDVKLMACIGAWLGPAMAIWTALYGALAGGLMAVGVAWTAGYLRIAIDNLQQLLWHFRLVGVRPHPLLTLERSRGPRLPYALPIAAGACVAMWLH